MKKLTVLLLAALMLLCACTPASGTSQPATTDSGSTTGGASEDAGGILWASGSGAQQWDGTLDLSQDQAVFDALYSPLSGDAFLSGTRLQSVSLHVQKAGKITLGSVSTEAIADKSKINCENSQTFEVTEGVNRLKTQLEIPYGHTLIMGGAGDSAVIFTSTEADSGCAATAAKGGGNFSVAAEIRIAERLEKNLTGVDLEKIVDLRGGSGSLSGDEGTVVFANDFFGGTTVTKLKFGMNYTDPGDTLTVSVVKMDLCGGSTITETLSTHTVTVPEEESGWDAWCHWEGEIAVPEGYTLAFMAPEDTAIMGYFPGKLGRTRYDRSMGFFHHCEEKADASFMSAYLLIEAHGTPTEDPALWAEQLETERKGAPLTDSERAELQAYLSDKSLSLLGDSITTYQGISNNAEINSTIGVNTVYYSPTERLLLEDTWWHQLIEDTGLTLCVNNSWSGSVILGEYGRVWTGRSENLHIDTDYAAENNIKAEPDLILVWMGTNDYNGNAPIGDGTNLSEALIREENGAFVYGEPATVAEAYAITLHKLRQRYPEADVLLMSPLNIKSKNDPNGERLKEFNAALSAVGKSMDMPMIDLSQDSGITYGNEASFTHGDGLHPNEAGMDRITACVERALLEYYRNK